MSTPETSQRNGTQRQISTVSISPQGLRSFNKIKAFLTYKNMNGQLSSEIVMDNLIESWYKVNQGIDTD